MASRRHLHQEPVNYHEMEIKLPKRSRSKDKDLYAVNVVDNDGQEWVKIHYVGYSSSHDEWRDETEIVSIDSQSSEYSMETDCISNGVTYAPFSLYN